MVKVHKHLNMLGMPVVDKVTKFKGVVTSICFDLYGCIQAIVHPGVDDSGKMGEQLWFDIARLEITLNKAVMDRPDFVEGAQASGKQGAAEKPKAMKA